MKMKAENCLQCRRETVHRVRVRYQKTHQKEGRARLRLIVSHCLSCDRRAYERPLTKAQKIRKGMMGYQQRK